MEKRCSRGNKCNNIIGCSGCSYQHFDKIKDDGNLAIIFLKNEYFELCSKKRKGTGGRVALDPVFRTLLLEARKFIDGFPSLKEMQYNELIDSINIGGEEYQFQVKCDGAFKFQDKYIFFEIKGYGDDTNCVLSAITAANLTMLSKKFHKHRYYYIGLGSSLTKDGLKRIDFFNKKRVKIAPYVKWAEENQLIKFYGIRDIDGLLVDIKHYCENEK